MARHGIQVLPMRIGRSVRVAEALLAHEPIMTYDPANAIGAAYMELGRWIDAQAS